MGSIPSHQFIGKLSSDETLIFKLKTLAELLDENDGVLKGVPYYPSGSMIDGLAATFLMQCHVMKLKGQLLVSWQFDSLGLFHLMGCKGKLMRYLSFVIFDN